MEAIRMNPARPRVDDSPADVSVTDRERPRCNPMRWGIARVDLLVVDRRREFPQSLDARSSAQRSSRSEYVGGTRFGYFATE